MIVLPITKSSSEEDDTPQEWSLLELNGELLPSKKAPDSHHMELGTIELNGDVSNDDKKLTINFPSSVKNTTYFFHIL